jgi:two-component system phosphate regulon response regulator PhoB
VLNGARILVVEDDPSLVELVRWHFVREGFSISHTADGEDALLRIADSPPDLVLLDWGIEGLPGVELCRRLRRAPATAALPVVMVTARTGEEERIEGLRAGADDYVAKPFSPAELVARVRAVLRRRRPALGGEVLRYEDLEMDLIAHRVRRGGRSIRLAPTEFRLLRHLLEHPERVFSRHRLLDAVWGRDSDVAPRSVDVQVRRLREAISRHGGPILIRTVRGAGYSLDRDEG